MHFHLHVIPKYSKNEGLEIKNGIANKYVGDVTDVYTIIMKSKDNFK
jgi:diadenosine tetraphosphate (Ap4A) HIT family hydrolase